MTEQYVALLSKVTADGISKVDWTDPSNIQLLTEMSNNYINYKIVTSVLWIVIWLLVFVASVFALKYLNKRYNSCRKKNVPEDMNLMTNLAGYLVVVMIVVLAILVGVTIYQTLNIIEYTTFPEKELLKYLSTLNTAVGG